MNKFIPYGHQLIEQDDIDRVISVLKGEWLTTGPCVQEFEEKFAKKVDARFAVACSSGTAALHLLTMAMGLREGDYSIVPTISFLSTANCNRIVGADVIFSDVDPDTGLITPDKLSDVLDKHDSSKIKILFLVHLNGQVCDIENLQAIAEKHGLLIVEDACHALGSEYFDRNKKSYNVGSCAHSEACVFSFHPVKTITTGEGGMITTNNQALYERLCLLRNHGMTRHDESFINKENAFDTSGKANPWYYEMHELGLNYRISDMNCALGISQLAKLDRFSEYRRDLIDIYDEKLKPLSPHVIPVPRHNINRPTLHLYPVRIKFDELNKERSYVMNELYDLGIGTQVHYYPIHLQPYYKNLYESDNCAGAWEYYQSVLSLPFHCNLSESDVEHIIHELTMILDL